MSRKNLVRDNFSRAAQTYDLGNAAQEQSAKALATLTLDALAPLMMRMDRPLRVLEIGCGTGGLTRQLAPKLSGQWVITDVSPHMLEIAQSNLTKLVDGQYQLMDGENPDPSLGQFDLIVSNLAFQWFEDLGQSVARLVQMLSPGGLLAFSTLGSKTFQEWRNAHSALGYVAGTPVYPNLAQLTASLPPHSQIMGRSFLLAYSSPLGFARSLRIVGANTPDTTHVPLPASALRAVMAQLKSPMLTTYDVMHCLIKA